jgi:hypothetical protein
MARRSISVKFETAALMSMDAISSFGFGKKQGAVRPGERRARPTHEPQRAIQLAYCYTIKS